jgi:transposase
MFSLNNDLRFHLYTRPTDMRKGFNGLYGIVHSQLGQNPLSGDVFVFINHHRNRIKMLRWETGGFVCYYKRLEKGTLRKIDSQESLATQISWTDLMLLIQGITVEKFHKRVRF